MIAANFFLSLVISVTFILSSGYSDGYEYSLELFEIHAKNTCKDWNKRPDGKSIQQDCELNFGTVLKCTGNVTASLLTNTTFSHARYLHFCGWPSQTFDPMTIMKYFPEARYLDIFNGNLTNIVTNFPDSPFLQVINISFTALSTINVNMVKNVRNLKILDLRFNKLKYMEAPINLPSGCQQLYLSGNNWNCSRSLRWLLNIEKESILIDRSIMICSDPKYQGRNLATVAYYKRVSKTECQSHFELRNCSCSVHYIMKSEDGKSLTPIYALNCSNLNFYNLPSYLPQNTTILYATNNKISDIRPLRDNARYRDVVDVYLDNNNIHTIDVLEAGYWLRHFRVLSLKKNLLQKLPVHAIDNALENNLNAVKLQLSLNPWVCDCKFVMRFREILMKYHTIIRDSWNVTCNLTNEENQAVETTILSLQRIDVCKLPTNNSIFALDVLNCVLTGLILFVLFKLGYDYYYYKNYGRLPWIITKMP